MPEGEQAQVTLRLAVAADGPRCADIFLAGRRNAFPWQPPGLFRLRDYYDCVVDEEVWVAEVDGQVVGFVSVALPDHVVHNLFVDAAWRKRGIGRALLDWALGHLDGVVHLRCAIRNLAAREFYERNGWVAVPTAAAGDFTLYRKLVGVGG